MGVAPPAFPMPMMMPSQLYLPPPNPNGMVAPPVPLLVGAPPPPPPVLYGAPPPPVLYGAAPPPPPGAYDPTGATYFY